MKTLLTIFGEVQVGDEGGVAGTPAYRFVLSTEILTGEQVDHVAVGPNPDTGTICQILASGDFSASAVFMPFFMVWTMFRQSVTTDGEEGDSDMIT